jgi:broad-specificity NMP kinase
MSGERFDYSNERQRHEKFVGRVALLARLDELLVDDGDDRWVVVTGGPGMGKSAILSAWLARREAAGAVVPHHFIRRGAYDWDDPAQMVGSLVAQIDECFPDTREPDTGARMHPAARLAKALSRVSEQQLGPRGERLVVLIDGLDEYDPPVGALPGDPLAAFLPHALPRGVSFLCACRPRHPYVSSLAARAGRFVQVDLDAPGSEADNDATVRTFWERDAGPLGLDARFVDEAVARAGGNVQHAVQLRRHIEETPAHLRRVEDIPRGLEALIEQTWERIAHDAVVVEGLGILCAAREALTLDELGAVAAWTGDATRRAFLRGAKEILVDTQRPDGQREYRLHHDSIRAHIAQTIGDVAVRGHHSALAQRLAMWPAPAQAVARRYTLRHALIHRAAAGDWADAWRIAGDTSFLEAKCRELGAHDVEADVARVAERSRAGGDATVGHHFSDLARALVRESHWLRAAPEATAAVLWNRLRRSGWSKHDLGNQLRVPVDAAFLHVRRTGTRESPALVRDLVGHSGNVSACVVTPDGRRVVSASEDQTLKVWDFKRACA